MAMTQPSPPFEVQNEEFTDIKFTENNNLPPPRKASKLESEEKAASTPEDEDDDKFEDAVEDLAPEMCLPAITLGSPDCCNDSSAILRSIQETGSVLRLFLDNRYESAKFTCEAKATRSFYHGLGLSTLLCIKASLTCESADIEAAVSCVDQTLKVCDKFRRSSTLSESIGKMVSWNKGAANLTDVEIHAELCTAECLLQRAFLTFLQDESLSSFVKGAYKIRLCFLSYKECERLLRDADWSPHNTSSREHFSSGTYMGIGTFNLMISSLPTRILKLLEFVGFPANKAEGLRLLEEGASMRGSLRSPLCALVLLSWHLVAVFVIDAGEVNLALCQKLLNALTSAHPNGALISFFRARYHMVLAEFDAAVECLQRAISIQNELPQLHHVCYWELMFCFMFTRQWTKAYGCADKLYQENKWSKCTYAYLCAIILYERRRDEPHSFNTDLEQLMDERFRSVSTLRQRIAGKSLPMEKFCVVKASRYLRTRHLVHAPVELLYFWSGFQMFGKNGDLIEPILAQVEHSLADTTQGLDEDDQCLCLFLKALCLRHTHSPLDAEICFKQLVKRNGPSLRDHTYLLPNAYVELAVLAVEREDVDMAKRMLSRVKDYKGFLFDSRLHFRVHALNARIRNISASEKR